MTLIELEKHLEIVNQIIFDVHISVFNAKLIGTKSTENENWVKEHPFFKHYFHQLKFIAVIQLSKLFTDKESQKFNFQKLFRQLESNKLPIIESEYYNSNSPSDHWITNRKSLEVVINRVKELIENEIESIEKLTYLRNTLYAHRDKKIAQTILSWPEIETLSNLSLNIYNEFSLGFFGSTFIFPNVENWSPSWIIKRTAKTRIIR